MRLIKKYQGGGGLVYRPLQTAVQQPMEPTGTSQEPQSLGLDKDIMKEMLGKGITNDVVAYTESVNQAFNEYQRLDPIIRNSAYGNKLRTIMKGDLGTLNMLTRNKQQLEDSAKQAVSNKAMDEIAITSFGVVVQDLDNGSLKEVSHEDFANILNSKDRKYRALTNAELLSQREYNKNLAGDTTSITALNSSIGMPKVKEEIWQILQYVGENKEKNTQAAIMAKALGDAKENANKGIFDVERMQSIESNKQQLEQAVTATWTNLSENSHSLLKARAAMNGAKAEDLDKIAQQYMIALLSPKQSIKLEKSTSEKFDSSATKHAFGEGAEKEGEMKYYEAFADGQGTFDNLELNSGSGYSLVTRAAYMGPFKKSDGNEYGVKSLGKMAELNSILDLDNVYIGNQKINRPSLNALVYAGGKVAQVELPAIRDRGSVKPDIEMATKLGTAKQALSKVGGDKATATVKETIFQKNGIPTDGHGNPQLDMQLFATFTGYVNKAVTDDPDEDKSLLEISSGKTGDASLATYESAYFEGATKDERKSLDRQYKDKIYKGSVFVPVQGSRIMGRQTDKSGYSIPSKTTSLDYMRSTDTGVEKGYVSKTYSRNSI